MKRVSILGATGSIGKSTLDILRIFKDDFEPVLLSAHTDGEGLFALSREFPGAALALTGPKGGTVLSGSWPERTPGGQKIYYGPDGLLRGIAESRADIAVNGIAGAAGLEPSLAVLDSGADLALANKETIVMAAALVFKKAAERQARILPVDSEHSAVFNLLEAHGGESLDEILLTASGGPFRKYTPEELAAVKPEDALVHPTWHMGPKITVDSASMANKGLEVIEAAGFFKLRPEQITVVVHPQSIVHSMIRLSNGAVYGEFSRPDMRIPIQNALTYPEKRPFPLGRLEFAGLTLEFEKPDYRRFPMLPLAYEALRRGALYPVVYNAANETAVSLFLAGRAGFLDIPRIVEYVLTVDWNSGETPNLGLITETDRKAREIALHYCAEIDR